jgi:hypothetical protein
MTGAFWGRAGAVLGLSVIAGAIGWACAGGGYETSWDPKQSSAILSPANDTRTNLLLLLADREGTSVADPGQMAKGIVPIEFSWKIALARLSPPPAKGSEPQSYDWEEPDASRCQSNTAGAAAFVEAVHAESRLSPSEKTALISAREQLKGSCSQAAGPALSGIASPSGSAFAQYLAGARQFYAGDFGPALAAFQANTNSPQPWVRETASYMVARTALNQAQAGSFDEYGSLAEPAKRDQAAIARAGQAFGAYLNAYPKGRYAASARGLLRRVAWLKDDRQALGSAYSVLLAGKAARDGALANIGMIDEIDRKLLPSGETDGVTDPTLLAIVDLMRLRPDGHDEGSHWDYRGAKLERAELEQQRPLFKANPALFDYLLGIEAFYGRKQAHEVLTLIPDAAHQQRFSYLQFSRQMLRGFALEAIGDRNARGFWLSLLPGATQPYQRGAVELALAEHDRKSGRIEPLFAAASPIAHPLIRQRLLEENAGAALLRQQARSAPTPHERDVSLYLLLGGDLHHGLYADFLKDVALVGARAQPNENQYYGDWSVDSYDPEYADELTAPPLYVFAAGGSSDLAPCPDIRATAASLSANPAAIRPRLCLAEFIRRKGFDGWDEQYDYRGGGYVTRTRSGFPGTPLQRIDIYRSVIAATAASADDKAFALNRAIRCFAPAGSSSCGGNDIPVEQRKAWFNQLKRDYPQSAWARDLKYYW